MKLTKLDVIRLWNAIEACKEHKNTKFIYAILKTKKLIKDEVEMLTALSSPSRKFQEYQKHRVELCTKYCEKENARPLIENGEYVFSEENRGKFEEELIKIKAKYKDWIDERDEQMANYNQMLKDEVDVEIHQVGLMYVPEDLNATVLEGLLPLIMEE